MTAAVLPEPIIGNQFWRNRAGEAIRVSLLEHRGRTLVDVRVFVTDARGCLVPTPKAVSC